MTEPRSAVRVPVAWPALLAALLMACGGSHVQAPVPDSPTDSVAAASELPAVVEVTPPPDSAADEAALAALQELEFKDLGKGDDRTRGVAALPTAPAVGEHEVSKEASRLFNESAHAADAAPSFDIDVESFAGRSRVLYYMNFFQVDARDRFAIWLGRMSRYEGMIRARFKAWGIPEDLVYLALIESGFSNTAVSRARAVGMWQFMAYTARLNGLVVNEWVDERRDPFKATDAAARHLLSLDSMFGSWYLAAAAYNGGTGRVMRGIRRLPGEPDSLTDATFFDLSDRRYLRRETRDYVPKLIAAALIAKDPTRYGFDDEVPALAPLEYDEITVPDATGLDVVARLSDTTTAALLELNPQYFRGVTPPRRESTVRVPRGSGTAVAQRYAELPVSERVNFVEHRVARGETLSEIGQRYRASVSLIQAANPGIRVRTLRIGTRLKIPVSAAARGVSRGSGRRVAQARVERPAAVLAGATHVVRAGETLWLLSRRYRVTIAELRRWNGLSNGDVLQTGQRLRVAPPVNDDGGSR